MVCGGQDFVEVGFEGCGATRAFDARQNEPALDGYLIRNRQTQELVRRFGHK